MGAQTKNQANTSSNAPESAAARNGQKRVSLRTAIDEMRPLIDEMRLVALNAEISAARLGNEGNPLGVVTREITTSIATLDDAIGDFEKRMVALDAKEEKAELEIENDIAEIKSVGKSFSYIEISMKIEVARIDVERDFGHISRRIGEMGQKLREGANALGHALASVLAGEDDDKLF